MIKTGQLIAGSFATVTSTGALTAATGTPAGTLYVAGVANGASVTITGANPYKWSVTLPTLVAGDVVQVYITATVSAIATGGFVFEEVADTLILSDGVTLANDAITSAKFDESTAFPLKSADSGTTELSRVSSPIVLP